MEDAALTGRGNHRRILFLNGGVNGDAGVAFRRFRSENHAQDIRKHPEHFGFHQDGDQHNALQAFTLRTDGFTEQTSAKVRAGKPLFIKQNRTFTI
ncbi:TPA: hypothetical protein ACTXAP_002427 [Raoultella planticola]